MAGAWAECGASLSQQCSDRESLSLPPTQIQFFFDSGLLTGPCLACFSSCALAFPLAGVPCYLFVEVCLTAASSREHS